MIFLTFVFLQSVIASMLPHSTWTLAVVWYIGYSIILSGLNIIFAIILAWLMSPKAKLPSCLSNLSNNRITNHDENFEELGERKFILLNRILQSPNASNINNESAQQIYYLNEIKTLMDEFLAIERASDSHWNDDDKPNEETLSLCKYLNGIFGWIFLIVNITGIVNLVVMRAKW